MVGASHDVREMYKLLMKVTYVRGRGFGASKLTATRYSLCMIVSHGTKEGEGARLSS